MFKLLAIFAVAMLCAHSSAQKSKIALHNPDYDKKIKKDGAYIVLLIAIILFAGLRIDYNDTWNYWHALTTRYSTFEAFWADEEMRGWQKNPAFHFYCTLIKQFSIDKTVFIMPTAIFSEYAFIRFFKKYSVEFDFTIFLFFTLGMFCFSMAAMKQTIAMGILTFAVEAADKKKYVKCILLIVLATLFHTYSLVFIVSPLLRKKPWSSFTWLMTIAAIIVFMNLESILGSMIDASEEAGKKLYEEELLGGTGSNIFRILVYAVPPIISFIFRKKLFEDSTPFENIMVHMSILSFACMAYGLVVSGNEADRLATYFEMGTLVCLPWMLKKAFDKETYGLVKGCACAAYFIFFVYKFYFSQPFDSAYLSIFSRYF